jgi:hypothetical protein
MLPRYGMAMLTEPNNVITNLAFSIFFVLKSYVSDAKTGFEYAVRILP